MDYDTDDDHGSYYINEFGDKDYKKRKTGHQKPKVNSFATRAKDDNHKKQDNKKNQSG